MWGRRGATQTHKVNRNLEEEGEIHFALAHQGGILEARGSDRKPEEWIDQFQAGIRGKRRTNSLKENTEHLTPHGS